MPPSKHSGSSRSAHKDSDEIPVGNMYVLGDYHFALERTSVPGSTNDKIEAICTKLNESKHARKSIQVPSSTKLNGWYVEANETEASVYVLIQTREGGDEKSSNLNTSPVVQPIECGNLSFHGIMQNDTERSIIYNALGLARFMIRNDHPSGWAYFVVSDAQTVTRVVNGVEEERGLTHSYTYQDKTVYYLEGDDYLYTGNYKTATISPPPTANNNFYNSSHKDEIAWTMVYGESSGGEYGEPKEMLVGRFAIEVEDAGGVGPGSDWVDPGDYDPDWEEGDPTHTLYVTVTGALSGRHNDPIEDPIYSYIPADKDTVKDYGCGGDGGHGGGGGAGASTVVIHKFATNQANSKDVTAIARRHGYGSGGGKGGKGGDGCVLVYY